MTLDFALSNLAAGPLLSSLLPDFVLAFTFFMALTYAVLGRRFEHQRSAIAMSAAVGLALAAGLVAWEYQHGWSIRNLGPLAVGFAVILLGLIMFQGIRQTGGSWSGALLAVGASLLVAWILGAHWPVADAIVQTFVIVALLIGIVLFLRHNHGPAHGMAWTRPQIGPEVASVRHDMRDLYQDEHVGARIDGFLGDLRQHTDVLVQHPEQAPDTLAQLRRILPAEGWLTQRLAALRTAAHYARRGQLQRIDELRHVMGKLPPDARKKATDELTARYAELQLDKRLERLDGAVAEVERRVKQLTEDAGRAVIKYDYQRLNTLLEEAEKLQAHGQQLMQLIERTEQKLGKLVTQLAKEFGGGEAQ
jgi:hypothetical protein